MADIKDLYNRISKFLEIQGYQKFLERAETLYYDESGSSVKPCTVARFTLLGFSHCLSCRNEQRRSPTPICSYNSPMNPGRVDKK